MHIQHRSGLEIEGVTVINNPIHLERSEILSDHLFTAEDGETYTLNNLRGIPEGTMQSADIRWTVNGYSIVHNELGQIGKAAIRKFQPGVATAHESPIHFANFGHVEIDDHYRGQGLGLPTYVAAQTTLSDGYRLLKTNNAKPTARQIWANMSEQYDLIDTEPQYELAPRVAPLSRHSAMMKNLTESS